ncbi:MAG: exodeoxyribonuclease VII large subunit [Rickettsiales bacterium]
MNSDSDLFSLERKTDVELSVSQLSTQIKNFIESKFGCVRVKGEISGLKIAPSGHLYFSLKDDKSVLACVCWKGNYSSLKCKPEEGMEVVCTGNITTYSGQSKYQLVVTSIENSGIGSLMAILEKRKRQLLEEGLFNPMHKKPIPFIPQIIGVVTSMGGAVIKDIIHRISDRFPCKVLIWPVLVQGSNSAAQITEAIEGFNRLNETNGRPDVIIVARGGGSIEDLWAFNEETVVRATFGSEIPIISAVGHETDNTLIDLVADRRAPTPTAAAEMAVPVRSDLQFTTEEIQHRMDAGIQKRIIHLKTELLSLARALPDLNKLTHEFEQRLDDFSDRLYDSALRTIRDKYNQVLVLASQNTSPTKIIDYLMEKFDATCHTLDRLIESKHAEKDMVLRTTLSLFDSYNYENTLKRGYTIVKNESKKIIKKSDDLQHDQTYSIQFSDGTRRIKPN